MSPAFARECLAGWLRPGLLCTALLCAGCRGHNAPQPSSTSPSASAATRAAPLAPIKGEQLEIPASTFNAGTVPGDQPRNPALEPRLTQVTLGSFRIDRLPFPNDPAQPPLTGVTHDQAEQHCAAEGKRLCTELEWELVCKGPQSLPFSTGNTWDERCGKPGALCASPFNAVGLGRMREWTASDSLNPDNPNLPIARGSAKDGALTDHRCAHRAALAADEHADDLGFRCCKGAPNAATVAVPQLGTPFQIYDLPPKKLSDVLASDTHTASLSNDLGYFSEPEATRTVLARGNGDHEGFSFTVRPLLWNPDLGTQFVIVSGHAQKDVSFVVALLVVADNEFRVAASMILRDEPGPVVLAYSNDIRPRLHYSTCWGCPGETGKLLYRAPDSVVITQP
jgi:hypothetical protein